MTDFLDEKKQEIKSRLDELAPLIEEYGRLQAAYDALMGAEAPAAPRGPRRSSSAKRSSGAGNGRRGRPKGSGTRSKEALRLVTERPGITIPELAEAMNIKQNYLYRVMPDLQKEGMVRKEGRGWHALEAA